MSRIMNNVRTALLASSLLVAIVLLLASCLKPVDCHTLSVRANDPAGGSVSGAGIYLAGTDVTLAATPAPGYYFYRWNDRDHTNPRQVFVEGDTTYTAFFYPIGFDPDSAFGPGTGSDTNSLPTEGFDARGASYATFSVSATKTIRFARGNLQYNPSSNTWRFAEHQYDRIGQGNTHISPSYNGWIDLFGWATSGWNNGSNAYQPWSTSTNNSDYFTGGNLTGAYAEADWAWHNPIINGGNQPHIWRLPTADEWNYLLLGRENAIGKFTYATVHGQHGLIILPDNWVTPSGITFQVVTDNWNSNKYDAAQWARMERAGALFFPTTGARRLGTQVVEEDVTGFYLSSTINNGDYYCHLSFSTIFGGFPIYAPGHGSISEGQGIRPILDDGK